MSRAEGPQPSPHPPDSHTLLPLFPELLPGLPSGRFWVPTPKKNYCHLPRFWGLYEIKLAVLVTAEAGFSIHRGFTVLLSQLLGLSDTFSV